MMGTVMICVKDNNFVAFACLGYLKVPRPGESRGPSSSSSVMVLLVLAVILVLSLPSCHASAACNQHDYDSLLPFFSNISSSPLKWSPSIDCCLWEGIECGGTGRVTRLWLPFKGLSGVLSPSLANLTYLSQLNLSHNRLFGTLPAGFFSSFDNLQILDLSYNRLLGELPSNDNSTANIAIRIVDLSSNRFSGVIPSNSFLQFARNLSSFNVSNNSFTGQIPSNICIVSFLSITALDFSYNDFSGSIPSGIGQCSNLRNFSAGFNNLSGTIPDDIYNVVLLEQLSLPLNNLSGTISDSLANLSNLRVLDLYSNQLIGSIPRDIGKLSKLEQLQLHINNLTGSLPPSLMNCTKLVTLNLRVNFLVGELSAYNFSRLQQLSILDLGNNNFTGRLPTSLYACKSLKAVRLAYNQLEGQILPDIQALESLSFLSVSYNNLTNLTGAIQIMMGCKNLTTLILSVNFMNETIPDEDTINSSGFQNLQVLGLGASQLSGQVPTWLAKLKNLEVLDLSFNQITGFIPSWLASLPSLFYIDLSGNLLSGEFPKELAGLPTLASQGTSELFGRSYFPLPVFAQPNNATYQYSQLYNLPPAIILGNNHLSGDIPIEIGQLKFIHVLCLNNNNFSGNIPDQISNLTNLEQLDLSGNHLSGEIPASLKGLHFLSSFSVRDNNLQGPIPSGGQFDTFPLSSFTGNPGLCGQILQRSCSNYSSDSGLVHPTAPHKSKNAKLVVGLVLGSCLGTGLLIATLALWILSKRRIIPGGDTDNIQIDTLSSNSGLPPEADKDTSLVILFPNNTDGLKDLTISELLKATDNFNQANIIGCGGFGLVYKATLANGTKLAIKKLSGEMGPMEREYKAEVEALSTAQHENLVSLQGYCVYEGFRLLLYSYMENGSLDYWLHEKADGVAQLDWPTRLKIARGTSCGLSYMHQICEPHIVHRDIKSSNILLDEKFEAHVADFGLSRLILPYHTHVTTELVGTLGYIPPEYGQAWIATLRGDMYSFGVVMLELLTGKRPVEVFKPKMSRELVGWVHQMRSDGKQDQIFDPLLRGKGFDDEMLQVLDVACMCVNQNPFKRPTIKEVVEWLKNVGSQKNQNKD